MNDNFSAFLRVLVAALFVLNIILLLAIATSAYAITPMVADDLEITIRQSQPEPVSITPQNPADPCPACMTDADYDDAVPGFDALEPAAPTTK